MCRFTDNRFTNLSNHLFTRDLIRKLVILIIMNYHQAANGKFLLTTLCSIQCLAL